MNILINKEKFKVVGRSQIFNFKEQNNCILLKKRNFFHTFLIGKVDVLMIDHRNSVIFKYINMPRFKIVKYDFPKEKTSILVLPQNASLGVKIGDVLTFESENII